MIQEVNKKLARRFWAGIIVVFIIVVSGILLFSSLYYKNLALALSGTYTKSTGDSLLATEWNNLASDLVILY